MEQVHEGNLSKGGTAIMYRYRLSDHEVNQGLKKRNFKGVTLFRDRWLYSERELFSEPNLKKWIVMETATSKEAFQVQDKVEEQKMKEQPIEQPKDLQSNTHEELEDMCYSLGFTQMEVQGKVKQYLISLIEMDLTLEGV